MIPPQKMVQKKQMPLPTHHEVAVAGNLLDVISGHLQGGTISSEGANTLVKEVFEFSEK
jgi:hypothetical protein